MEPKQKSMLSLDDMELGDSRITLDDNGGCGQSHDMLLSKSLRSIDYEQRGSSTNLLIDSSRSTSTLSALADLVLAVSKRLSLSSAPNATEKEFPTVPLMPSTDKAAKTIGSKDPKGTFSEHLYPLETIADHFLTHIDYANPTNSRGLTEGRAGELLLEFGPNVLTPPPKVPLWVLFLLQFTNLLMVLLIFVSGVCIVLFVSTGCTVPSHKKPSLGEEGKNKTAGSVGQAQTLLEIASLNSRVALESKEGSSELVPNGDATELGLYRFVSAGVLARFNRNIEEFRAANPKVHEIPFNSAFKWQMTVHKMESTGKQTLFLKGAPDVLLGKCGSYMDKDGSIKPIDAEFQRIYTAAYEDFGGNGERVLGFAMRPMATTI
eukprot:gene20235-22990_t